MFDDEKGLYTIGMVSDILNKHPETLRVWERNLLIKPLRQNSQRRYSNNDLLRLRFIIYLIDEKGLNVAGVREVVSMYPCWFKRDCPGGAKKNSATQINEARVCWKKQETYCLKPIDKAEICAVCLINKSS